MSLNFRKVLQFLCILSTMVCMVCISPSARCWEGIYDTRFCTLSNYRGKILRLHMKRRACYNFRDYNMENLVGSVDPVDHCVMIFDDIFCKGNSLRITSDEICGSAIAKCGMYKAKSTRLC